MLSDNDRIYLERREADERRLAEEATDLGARKIHREMAERYAAKLQGTPVREIGAQAMESDPQLVRPAASRRFGTDQFWGGSRRAAFGGANLNRYDHKNGRKAAFDLPGYAPQ